MNTMIFFPTRWLLTLLTLLCCTGLVFPQGNILLLGNSNTRGVDGPSTDDAGYRNDLAAALIIEGVGLRIKRIGPWQQAGDNDLDTGVDSIDSIENLFNIIPRTFLGLAV